MTEATGPLGLIVLGIEGSNFTGEITPARLDLDIHGIVRIVNLAIVIKEANDETTILEMQDRPEDVATAMFRLAGEFRGLMSEADLLKLAEDMLPDSTGAVFLCKTLWATRFASIVRSADGKLVMSERIPGGIINAAREGLLALGADRNSKRRQLMFGSLSGRSSLIGAPPRRQAAPQLSSTHEASSWRPWRTRGCRGPSDGGLACRRRTQRRSHRPIAATCRDARVRRAHRCRICRSEGAHSR
jgi:hypothetical protein